MLKKKVTKTFRLTEDGIIVLHKLKELLSMDFGWNPTNSEVVEYAIAQLYLEMTAKEK